MFVINAKHAFDTSAEVCSFSQMIKFFRLSDLTFCASSTPMLHSFILFFIYFLALLSFNFESTISFFFCHVFTKFTYIHVLIFPILSPFILDLGHHIPSLCATLRIPTKKLISCQFCCRIIITVLRIPR